MRATLIPPVSKEEKASFTGKAFSYFKQWSWTIAFILFCAICLEQALKKKKEEYLELQRVKVALEKQIDDELAMQEDLIHQINSQSDPAWVELTLMKQLGLVPEGQRKVIFKGP